MPKPIILAPPADISPSETAWTLPFPQYYLVRPEITKHTATGTITSPGPMVPLIPMDQLPDWILIFGVPRELEPEQTVGMCNVGTVVKSPDLYEVRLHKDVRFAADDDAEDRPYRGSGRVGYVQGSDVVKTPATSSCGDSTCSSPHRMDPGAKEFTGAKNKGDAVDDDDDADDGVHHDSSNNGSISKDDDDDASLQQGPGDSTPSSPTVCSSNTTSHTVTSSSFLKPKGNRKASKVDKSNGIAKSTDSQSTVVVPLNARIPTPPPPKSSSNPYPLIHHHHSLPAPLPSPHHPASRFLGTFAPGAESSSYNPNAPRSRTGNNNNDQQKKTPYCRHWCRFGSCRYGLLCRHDHVMPPDVEGLHEVGLDALPTWWVNAVTGRSWYGGGMPMGMGIGGLEAAMAPRNSQERRKMRARLEQKLNDYAVGGGVGGAGAAEGAQRRLVKKKGVADKDKDKNVHQYGRLAADTDDTADLPGHEIQEKDSAVNAADVVQKRVETGEKPAVQQESETLIDI